jgi:hypothetical protein
MHPQYWSRVVWVSSTNPIPYASDAIVGRCRSTMRRLDNLKRYTYRPCIFAVQKLLLLFSFTSLLTSHRTLVNTHKINKCAKFGSILLGVSREDDDNIVSKTKSNLGLLYTNPGITDNNLKGKTHKITSPMSSTECE